MDIVEKYMYKKRNIEGDRVKSAREGGILRQTIL